MNRQNSAIHHGRRPLSPGATGLWWGALGVLAFSWTVPLTKIAVDEGLDPALVGYGRAVVPGVLAILLLLISRQRMPSKGQWVGIAVVAAGGVVGFPIFTSLAAQSVPASHSAVVVGLLPLATAVLSVLRSREHPPVLFWGAAIAGAVAVMTFVGLSNGGLGGVGAGDLYLVGAVIACAVGYAEGGVLARTIGAWQTICWALALALIPMTVLTVVAAPTLVAELRTAGPSSLVSLAYLSLVSMFLGYFAWYRGLGIGPVSRVSQIQMLQPMISVLWAAIVVGERPGPYVVAGAAVVLVAAMTAIRARRRPAVRETNQTPLATEVSA